MTRRLAHRMPIAALAAAALLVPATAHAQLDEYQGTGKITPCKYTPGQLNSDIPNDVAQYAPDYADALRDAARTGCGGSAPVKPTTDQPTGVPVGAGGQPLPPGSVFVRKPPGPPKAKRTAAVKPAPGFDVAAAEGAKTPAPIIALAVLLSLMLVVGGAVAAGRHFGVGLGPLGPLGHAFSEAGDRLGGLLSGLAERLRSVLPRRS